MMRRTFSSSVSFEYGCVYVVVRKMDDGRLASVVVYIYLH